MDIAFGELGYEELGAAVADGFVMDNRCTDGVRFTVHRRVLCGVEPDSFPAAECCFDGGFFCVAPVGLWYDEDVEATFVEPVSCCWAGETSSLVPDARPAYGALDLGVFIIGEAGEEELIRVFVSHGEEEGDMRI